MTTAKTVGALSSEAEEWYAINWLTIHQNVRRLQVRIVQATKAGRWNKVKSLQRLLPLLQRQGSRRSTSDGKYWQENSRCGPDHLENTGR
jgi:hypothetical protein